ncbi:putative defense protein Hdd11-like [Pomacea canaliculata]|uniref:putative defense protein Hdd11-like n=1 Tax=Pomacea canaliculata TaxID=400727 RepID=UPI000D73FD0F|nr:putative defense protein Hdd11-like [Pomacea canaliculata]
MFVQARLADDCSVTSPIGSFNIPVNDNFMQQMVCDKTNDAVSHRMKSAQNSKSFIWTPPPTIPGTIYFRATVVYNKTTFWTDVFSEFLLPSGAKPNPQYCPVQKTFVTTTSSATKVTSTKVSSTVRASDAWTVSSARVLTVVVCVVAVVAVSCNGSA